MQVIDWETDNNPPDKNSPCDFYIAGQKPTLIIFQVDKKPSYIFCRWTKTLLYINDNVHTCTCIKFILSICGKKQCRASYFTIYFLFLYDYLIGTVCNYFVFLIISVDISFCIIPTVISTN